MKLLPITLLTASLCASIASAETVRLVMSEKLSKAKSGQISALPLKHSGCVRSEDGKAQWCFGFSTKAKAKSNSVSKASQTIVFEVDSQGYLPQDIADAFNKGGRFGLVEIDIPIKSASFMPDDPSMYRQEAYMDSTERSVTGMNIFGLWNKVGETAVTEKDNPVDVIIMDSSFVVNDQVEYFDGRSFSTTALEQGGPGQERSNDYTPPAEVAELHCNPHGLGVAGTINAKLNNNLGTAGITNNVNLYALRVMTCGTGFASDFTAALDWLAGESIEGVNPYQGAPAIINLSLGGSDNEKCPNYIQSSINKAVDAGFTIVVSASNDSIDVATSSPANCDNVITVAALDESGDLAEFSNFGSQVDVVAHGVDIQSPCTQESDSACWWEGTSFATPLVAGGLAVVKQQTGASNEVLTAALELSSSLDTLSSHCQTGICGKGLPDFEKVLDIANQSQAGTLNTIEFALNDSDVCEQTWFIDHFGGMARMCELYKVSFYGGYRATNSTYQMLSVAHEQSWESGNVITEGVFEQGSVMLKELDIANRKYGFKVCQNGHCGDVMDLNSSLAQDDMRPAICNN